MGLKEVVRGVVGLSSFRKPVYCQSCRRVITEEIVVSAKGNSYHKSQKCLIDATTRGDEIENPLENGGNVYSRRMVGFAVGSGRLVHYKEPQDIARSPR